MNEFKKGILSAIMESNEIIPQVIIQFDDAVTGAKAKMTMSKDNPALRAEQAALSITDTMDNNRIGKLSDWVPVLWDRIAQGSNEAIAKMSDDERMEMLAEILKCDAQVNLSIDFAKKKPDVEDLKRQGLEWVCDKGQCKNKLESEVHKHAGKKDNFKSEMTGKDYFRAEIPDEEGELEGTNSILVKMHNLMKDIPDTVGLARDGLIGDGHIRFRVENHETLDKSRYQTAFWKNCSRTTIVERHELCNRLAKVQEYLDEREADKIENLKSAILKDFALTNPNVENEAEWLKVILKLSEVLDGKFAAQQVLNIFGAIAQDKRTNSEEAWKTISNFALRRYIAMADHFEQFEEQSIADAVRAPEAMVRCFAKSWALAKAENEHTEEIELPKMTTEEAEAIAEEMGF